MSKEYPCPYCGVAKEQPWDLQTYVCIDCENKFYRDMILTSAMADLEELTSKDSAFLIDCSESIRELALGYTELLAKIRTVGG